MGVRLFSVFVSDYGSDFTIEIHDTEFTGTPSEFKTDSRGFTLDYSSQTDDIVSPIIGSSCTVGMYVENVNQENDLINLLKDYQEDRFYIRIYSSEDSRVIDITDTTVSNFNTRVQADEGTVESTSCIRTDIEDLGGAKFYIPSVSEDIYWVGKITQDLVAIEDDYYPYKYEITAVDGLGLLANYDYTTSGNKTLLEVFKESIDLIGVDHLYTDLNFYLSTCYNLWDINQTYDVDTDATQLVRFNTLVYRETNDDGSYTQPKALDILKELCTIFGARIYQRRGSYVLEQYKEREDVEYRYFKYDKNGDEVLVEDRIDDADITQTSYEGARLAGGAYNFLPALKKVEITYNQTRLSNLLANRLTFTQVSNPVSLGTLVNDDNGQVLISGDLYYSFLYDGSGPQAIVEFYMPIFRIELKQEDIQNPGTYYYLQRNFTPGGGSSMFGATSWTTTPSYYYLEGGVAKNSVQGLNLASNFNVITPPLQVDGNTTLDIEFYNIYDLAGNVQTVPVNYTSQIAMQEITAKFLTNGTPGTTVQVFTSTNGNTKVSSNLSLDLGEVKIGDSQGLDGSFYIYDGSNWVPSTSWRRGNSGSYINLYKLLTKEVLSLHRNPIERYSGTILAPYTYGTRLVWGGKYYLPTTASYNAGFDEWSGEWFAIDADETDITVSEPVDLEPVDATFTAQLSGQSGTDSVIIGTEVFTNNITADNDVTATGNISGADLTASGDLDVTGVSTLKATNLTDLNHTGKQIESITEVENSPGSTYTVQDSDYMIFNTWETGAPNGTAQINLPPAVDNEGRLLRFKSDGSIGTTRDITLSPDGSDTIDGEASYSFNRDYDGLMILAYRSDWYVIQRKAK